MKVLSVMNPAAVYIAAGLKDVENRGQRTNYRGRILIHTTRYDCAWINSRDMPPMLQKKIVAARDATVLTGDVKCFDTVLRTCIKYFRLSDDMDSYPDPAEALKKALEKYGPAYPRGAIIGEVDIVDCIQDAESEWAIPYKWHWVLQNAKLYPVAQQIRNVKGHLGLWNYS